MTFDLDQVHRTDFFYKGITITVSQERSQGTCNVPHLATGVGQVARRGGQYILGLLLARLKGQLERREIEKIGHSDHFGKATWQTTQSDGS